MNERRHYIAEGQREHEQRHDGFLLVVTELTKIGRRPIDTVEPFLRERPAATQLDLTTSRHDADEYASRYPVAQMQWMPATWPPGSHPWTELVEVTAGPSPASKR